MSLPVPLLVASGKCLYYKKDNYDLVLHDVTRPMSNLQFKNVVSALPCILDLILACI